MMPLTDAIRLGSMIRPKCSFYFFFNGQSCAQGAALEATGTPYTEFEMMSGKCRDHHVTMIAQWPWTQTRRITCPVCGHEEVVKDVIAHLNNTGIGDHDWSREQIADWLETIDPDKTHVEAPVTTEPVAV